MTPSSDSEDSQWFDALAGNPSPAADPKVNQQASVVREALQARSQRLDQDVPKADAAQYQKILLRLQREGLTQQRKEWYRFPGGGLAAILNWHKLPVWGLAASLMVGIALVVQMSGVLREPDKSMILRGGDQATTLVVADPEVRLAELLTGLKAAGAEPQVERIGNGRIALKLKATQTTLDYLDTQRIAPAVKDGQIVLVLSPQSGKR